ncbi:MAG: NifB/NifX family molybdenum-iron cluster-binding protein [Dehalococcoidales bacterium]|nr:NifB/NifX family molybdenum-iron cluster-binding protein [Dehalococcoidales bacterium]
MKYAVPVSGGGLCPHFGHCEEFALIDVDEKKKVILKQTTVPAPEHQPGLLPPWLAKQGVNCVIAGGMGMSAQNLFTNNGVTVVTGVMETDPEKAVLNHLNGNLATGSNVCDHDSHECAH